MIDQDEAMVDVLLVGGPGDIPETQRTTKIAVSSLGRKIKLAHRTGYEHFEPLSAGPDGAGPLVFHWTGSTKIAE